MEKIFKIFLALAFLLGVSACPRTPQTQVLEVAGDYEVADNLITSTCVQCQTAFVTLSVRSGNVKILLTGDVRGVLDFGGNDTRFMGCNVDTTEQRYFGEGELRAEVGACNGEFEVTGTMTLNDSTFEIRGAVGGVGNLNHAQGTLVLVGNRQAGTYTGVFSLPSNCN